MKTLSQKEWIAVVVGLIIITITIIIPSSDFPLLEKLFGSQQENTMEEQNEFKIEDEVVGEGQEVVSGDKVSVHYTGTLTDGTVFDSSVTRGTPFEFVVGAGMVIEGWEKGVLGMKVGGKRSLVIPSDMAYGDAGIGPIPGGATIIFAIELLAIGE